MGEGHARLELVLWPDAGCVGVEHMEPQQLHVATAAVRTAMSFAPSCAARGGAPSPEREGGKGDGGQYCNVCTIVWWSMEP